VASGYAVSIEETMRELRVLITVLSMSLSLFAAESPFTGTWKLNPAKSMPPAPKAILPSLMQTTTA
jgi:hypothetical protein